MTLSCSLSWGFAGFADNIAETAGILPGLAGISVVIYDDNHGFLSLGGPAAGLALVKKGGVEGAWIVVTRS